MTGTVTVEAALERLVSVEATLAQENKHLREIRQAADDAGFEGALMVRDLARSDYLRVLGEYNKLIWGL